MAGYVKSGQSAKVNGFWAQVECTPSGTYGRVYTEVQEVWGREGDLHNPRRTVIAEKCVATTAKFPAYHTDGAWRAARELLAEKAGVPLEVVMPPEPKPARRRARKGGAL